MINIKEIKKIADLCKVDFDNLQKFSEDFAKILDYVKVISKVQGQKEAKKTSWLEYADLRDDQLEKSLSREAALANRQSKDSDVYFSVPKTVKR